MIPMTVLMSNKYAKPIFHSCKSAQHMRVGLIQLQLIVPFDLVSFACKQSGIRDILGRYRDAHPVPCAVNGRTLELN